MTEGLEDYWHGPEVMQLSESAEEVTQVPLKPKKRVEKSTKISHQQSQTSIWRLNSAAKNLLKNAYDICGKSNCLQNRSHHSKSLRE